MLKLWLSYNVWILIPVFSFHSKRKSNIKSRASFTQSKTVYMYMVLGFLNVIGAILEFLK